MTSTAATSNNSSFDKLFLNASAAPWKVVLMLAGALIRVSFVLRHQALAEARPVPWRWAIAGTLIVVLCVAFLMPAPQAALAKAPPPTLAQVETVIGQRCQICHNAVVASKSVRLDTPEQIALHAQQIYQQAVVLKLMPMNNATQITDAERAMLGRWFEAGAPN